MLPFTEKVVKIIKQIPPGSVMSYGQIADLAGSKRGARQVARILHTMSEKYSLPWHRVVNRKGEIVLNDLEHAERQKELLLYENVLFKDDHTIDLTKCRFTGDVCLIEVEDFHFK